MNPNRFLLNSPVLTAFGSYRFEKIDLESARDFVKGDFTSAIGHHTAAQFLSVLLEVDVPVQRISIAMELGDQALVLRLLARLPEGAVLTSDQMAEVPYELGIFSRFA